MTEKMGGTTMGGFVTAVGIDGKNGVVVLLTSGIVQYSSGTNLATLLAQYSSGNTAVLIRGIIEILRTIAAFLTQYSSGTK